MYLTTAICTWNRAPFLDIALSAFRDLNIPQEVEWELLVVNNNSTDNTDEIISKHSTTLPIRRLFEPHPGKSFALNHASREAKGEYIIWTDDDALVDPDWIMAYSNAFKRWPESAIFGGPVKPWFRTSPPRWLNETTLPLVSSAYAIREFEDESFVLTPSHLPFGVNMAVRAKEQSAYPYDTNLGPRPNSALRGEETAMLLKMIENGISGRWVPDAFVRHYIPEERQTLRYLKEYYKGHGEYQWIEISNSSGPNRFGGILAMFKTALNLELRYRYHKRFGKPQTWMNLLIRSSKARGRLRQRSRAVFRNRHL